MMSVIVRVQLARLLGVMLGLDMMTVRHMGMVSGRFMVSLFIVFRRGAVVVGRVFVMFGSFEMMLDGLF